MTTFASTTSPTPFGVFDTETAFQTEADNIVVWVKRKLGDDILSVELTKKQIWACFEESSLEYGSLINQYQAKSQMNIWLGQPTGSLTGKENIYPRENLEYLIRFAEPYAMEAGIGGIYDSVSGSIALTRSVQDYDIYAMLKDANGQPLFNHHLNTTNSKMKIREVYHFSPNAAYRFFDTTSAVNYLNNEFSFESFTPETIFYVLPVFEDILRAGQMDVSQRVRRSNYYYKIMGRNLRIFPTPSKDTTLHMRVQFIPDPTNPLVSALSGSMSESGSISDQTVFGVSNISNLPFGNIKYGKMNSIARQWVRQFTLALSKELLGLVRSKFSTVPIPGAELTLNGSELITQGREDKEKLKTEMKEMLESLTYDKLVEVEANRSEQIQRQLKMVPMPNGMAIFTG